MIAVHFGAGNIGRGFIAQLLHQAGYEIVFLDVNEDVVGQLKHKDSYRVIETGAGATTHTITNFTALSSSTEFDLAAQAISSADVLTTSVGPNILKFLAPLIVAGLNIRDTKKPLVIMACENAIKATDILRTEIASLDPAAAEKALFANTAVDRIVPPQKPGLGLDVLVEAFSEWVIDSSSLGASTPVIPGAIFVSDLAPYIERKLFTVNTGHATLAYVGQKHGHSTIVEASSDPEVLSVVRGAIDETSQVLISRHAFDAEAHKKYVEKTIQRFTNPELDDPVSRVGREPARKLARHDRLVGPAAYLAEQGIKPVALLEAIEAALQFKDDSDPGVESLRGKLNGLDANQFVAEVMGITSEHALAQDLTSLVEKVKQQNYSY